MKANQSKTDGYKQEYQELLDKNAELEQTVESLKRVEIAVQESEEKYRTLFESSAEGILLMHNDVFIDCNALACDHFACSRDEIIGKSPLDFSPLYQADGTPSDNLIQEKVDAALAGTPQFFEWQHQRKNGELFEAEISLKRIVIDGTPILQATNRDISQRRLSENTLKSEKEKLESLINGLGFLGIGVDIITSDFDIVFQNQILVQRWGKPGNGKCYQKYHGSNKPCGDCLPMNAIKHNRIFRKEIRGSDGRFYEVIAAPFHNGDKEIDRAIEVAIDITDRRIQNEKLRRSEERFRAIFNNAPIGITLVNRSGYFELTNQVVQKLTGYSKEELTEFKITDLSHPDDKAISVQQLEKLFVGKLDRYQLEKRYLDKNGNVIWINLNTSVLHNEQEQPEIVIGMIEDITKRKQMESELRGTLNELDQLKQRLEKENEYLLEEINLTHNFGEIIGKSKKLKKLLKQIEQVADSDSTVLMLGETGTGKEMFARAIHNLSRRKVRPLVKVNCAALPANLIESELFGHEKGAFTGAINRKVGKFELANHGTIFLDEMGDLPFDLQAKLLRVLQENEIERLGGNELIKVDVRVLAATNKDLEAMKDTGEFREDLFYRLNVFPLECPPLRERKDDIPMLTRFFLEKYNQKNGKQINRLSEKTVSALHGYDWPGNVRELENIIERAVVLSSGSELQLGNWFSHAVENNKRKNLRTLDQVQAEHITHVLEETNGRIDGKNGAAIILGMKPPTLRSRMQKLGVKVEKKIRDIS